MVAKALRIAWLGPGPSEDGGVGGVTTELLSGLSALGHQIDCFLPGRERPLPSRLTGDAGGVTFIWGTSGWQWNRWYSRAKITAFVSGLLARSFASVRLRREIVRRHREHPYDLVYQFSNIEALALPARIARTVPLVIHPETHIAGELRFLIAERRLVIRSESLQRLLVVGAVMLLRVLVQRIRIRRARLLVCISSVFRDHLVHDYGFPLDATVVVPNPVRLERFAIHERPPGELPTILVLGRIAVRKGVEDVVAVARALRKRGVSARIRIVGGPSLFSDYTKLLEELPSENAEYVGGLPASAIPGELARSDILLQASKYEPFGLTVAEALACGVPVVATSEVGAIDGVSREVVSEVKPGDVEGMASAITELLARSDGELAKTRALARAEAERLFSPHIVCQGISDALAQLLAGTAAPPSRPPTTVAAVGEEETHGRTPAAST
jgi:glycosyltransferase involved in cell wall biosynthesis